MCDVQLNTTEILFLKQKPFYTNFLEILHMFGDVHPCLSNSSFCIIQIFFLQLFFLIERGTSDQSLTNFKTKAFYSLLVVPIERDSMVKLPKLAPQIPHSSSFLFLNKRTRFVLNRICSRLQYDAQSLHGYQNWCQAWQIINLALVIQRWSICGNFTGPLSLWVLS